LFAQKDCSTTMPLTPPRLHRSLIAIALVLASALSLRGAAADHRAHLSNDLVSHLARHTTDRTRAIVRGSRVDVEALAARHRLTVLRYLAGSAVVAVNSAELADLIADSAATNVSGDLPVFNGMSVSNQSTAADQTRAGKTGLLGLGSIPKVNGDGIGVAVIDSGISPHAALVNKIVVNVGLVTGDPSVNDAFGHGTHVAGIIAGSAGPATAATNLYTGGIAPGAQLINIRVLGANGVGLTSDVIAGIEWAIANRVAYNIRVINLSLGHPVTEPSEFDPLCQAVADAFQAGIVVVAAGGNQGVSAATGAPMLGGITSPGNSPFAITVGALNTWGTVQRSDDTVATYSSRGPTAFDLAVKPDLAAPGNKIVSLEAAGSYLPATYSSLHVAGTGTNAYMQLSGTSMATPMVSGAVALLLQGTPTLSPSQVKFALQAGSTYMPQGGLMGAGAGSVNIWSSRQFAANPLVSLPTALIARLLTAPSGAAFTDAGTMTGRLYAGSGLHLLSLVDLLLAWLNLPLLQTDNLNLIGLGNPLAAIAPNPLLWGEVASWTSANQIIWGSTIYNPQGEQIIWGSDQTTEDNQIIWGSSVLASPDAH
jgi:serine protease AprX